MSIKNLALIALILLAPVLAEFSLTAEGYVTGMQCSTPGEPCLNGAYGIEVLGDYAYVTSISDAFGVIDISNPTTPTPVAHVGGGDSGWQCTAPSDPCLDAADEVRISGDYAYVVSINSNSLVAINIVNPLHPTPVGHISGSACTSPTDPCLDSPRDIYISGNYAYVVSAEAGTLVAIDITDPTAMVAVKHVTKATAVYLNGAESIHVQGNYAYIVSSSSSALTIVDLTTMSPVGTLIGNACTNPGDPCMNFAKDVYVSGNYAYVVSVSSNALVAIDISNPETPTPVGHISGSACSDPENPCLGGARSVYIQDNYAYIASAVSRAIVVVDITNPTDMRSVAHVTNLDYPHFNIPQSVHVLGDYAYFTDNSNTFTVVKSNYCGDGLCADDETCDSCPDDCEPCCPNGACDYGETYATCMTDCPECDNVGIDLTGEGDCCSAMAVDTVGDGQPDFCASAPEASLEGVPLDSVITCDDSSDGSWDALGVIDLSDSDNSQACVSCTNGKETGIVYAFEAEPTPDKQCEVGCGADLLCDELYPGDHCDGDNTYCDYSCACITQTATLGDGQCTGKLIHQDDYYPSYGPRDEFEGGESNEWVFSSVSYDEGSKVLTYSIVDKTGQNPSIELQLEEGVKTSFWGDKSVIFVGGVYDEWGQGYRTLWYFPEEAITCSDDCCDSDGTGFSNGQDTDVCYQTCLDKIAESDDYGLRLTDPAHFCDYVDQGDSVCVYDDAYVKCCDGELKYCQDGTYCDDSLGEVSCLACSTVSDGVCQSPICCGTDPDCECKKTVWMKNGDEEDFFGYGVRITGDVEVGSNGEFSIDTDSYCPEEDTSWGSSLKKSDSFKCLSCNVCTHLIDYNLDDGSVLVEAIYGMKTPFCRDGTCNGDETWETCPYDCCQDDGTGEDGTCHEICGADSGCDGNAPGWESDLETAVFGCSDTCEYIDCGYYGWNAETYSCKSSCNSFSDCAKGACILTDQTGSCLEESDCSTKQGALCDSGNGVGICVDDTCCSSTPVYFNDVYSCASTLVSVADKDASCDLDLSDNWDGDGMVVYSSDKSSAKCCPTGNCFCEDGICEGDTCVSDDTFINDLHCTQGAWEKCDETKVCDLTPTSGLYCTYPDQTYEWTPSQAVCGDSCSSGMSCDANGECLTDGTSNKPLGVTCTDGEECCTGICEEGVCSAVTVCDESHMSKTCVAGIDRYGICGLDCVSGNCQTYTCCEAPNIGLFDDVGYGCFESASAYPTTPTDISCDQNLDGAADGFLRSSFTEELACCEGHECYDGETCQEEGTVSGTTICDEGIWVECTTELTCAKRTFGDTTLTCSYSGWVENPVDDDLYCYKGQKIECDDEVTSDDDDENTFAQADSIGPFLCTHNGMEYCNSTRVKDVGPYSFICNSTDWVECVSNDALASSADSFGFNTTEGAVKESYLCVSNLWKGCDSSREGQVFEVGTDKFVCASNNWLTCDEGGLYQPTNTADYQCGCVSKKGCIDLSSGKFGICADDLCCTAYTDFSNTGCFANDTAACKNADSGEFVDSLADGYFNFTGVCVQPSGIRCIDDGKAGKMVVSLNDSSKYIGNEKCISAARSEYLGYPCDDDPDGVFDGVIIYEGGKYFCGEEPTQLAKEEITDEEVEKELECLCPDDGDVCTDDYCKDGKCIHERVCETCGNGFCAPGECESCPTDCDVSDCRDNVCNPQVGEGCDSPDCDCAFSYELPKDQSFELNDSKSMFVGVKNTGNFKETFSVYLKGVKYELDKDKFSLDPGASRKVRVSILEENPGSYLFEVNIKPEHGSEYTKSVLTVIKGAAKTVEMPFIATNTFKYGLVGVILLIGFGSAAVFAKQIKGKVQDVRMNRQIYNQDAYNQQQSYYNNRQQGYYQQGQQPQQKGEPQEGNPPQQPPAQ